jgi:hypothetical protein
MLKFFRRGKSMTDTSAPTNDTIIPAAANFVLIACTLPDAKPTMEALIASMRTVPITAWRITPQSCEPITFVPPFPDAGFRAISCPSGHVIEVGGAGRDWNNFELMKVALLAEWTRARPLPTTVSVIPGVKPMPVTHA